MERRKTVGWREVLLDQRGIKRNAMQAAQAAEQPQRVLMPQSLP